MEILDVSGNVIPERWRSEFCGLFAGEGCLFLGRAIRTVKHSTYFVYRPEAIISLRADDRPLLFSVQELLGGAVSQRSDVVSSDRKSEHPRWRWYVQSRVDLLRVASILEEALLPAKKWSELPLWKESILLRKMRGQKHSSEENSRLNYLFHAIRDIRTFKVL